jgi:molybdate transport system substrate-binding protein
MKLRIFLAASLLLATIASAETISVSAAISMKDALSDISAEYQKETGDQLEFNYGASGDLAMQIKQGAPVDVFISAAWPQMKDLVKNKFADETSVKVIVANSLVLIAPADAKMPPANFTELKEERFKKIAVGEPKTVPAGQYAKQTLTSLKIFDDVKDRLVFGANVRQVLSYVERGEVDAGIVYKTDAIQSGKKVQVMATADAASHDPIEYPAAIISQSKHHEAAMKFMEFLSSDTAKRAFGARGFEPVAK